MKEYTDNSLIGLMAHTIGFKKKHWGRKTFSATRNLFSGEEEKLEFLYEHQMKDTPILSRMEAYNGNKVYAICDFGLEYLAFKLDLNCIENAQETAKLYNYAYLQKKDWKSCKKALSKVEHSETRHKTRREDCENCPFYWNDSVEYDDYRCHLFGDDIPEWAVIETYDCSTCNIHQATIEKLYKLYNKACDHEYYDIPWFEFEQEYEKHFGEDVYGYKVEEEAWPVMNANTSRD